MVKTEPSCNQVKTRVDMPGDVLQPILNVECALVVQVAEPSFAGQGRIHRPQQPVEVEMVTRLGPFLQFGLHGIAGVGPFGADLGQRKITLGEFRTAAVHAVEDVDNNVEGLVLPCYLLNVQIGIEDAEQVAHANAG